MDKQQIIEYLNAVCDAESIVQACNETIVIYEERKKKIVQVSCFQPECPIKQAVPYTKRYFDIFSFITPIAILSLVYYIAFAFVGASLFNAQNNSLGVLLIIAVISAVATVYASFRFRENQAYNEAENKVERTYAEQMKQYEKQLADSKTAYNKACEVYSIAISKLDAAIRMQQEHRDNAQKKLDELYARNVLYPTFRNLVAAYQIREYLQMGICETLDGANGAYAQYMQDVRTQRVCESIDDLKEAVVSAIYALQSTLVGELRQINGNLSNLNGTMEDSFNKLNSNMRSMQQATAEQIGGYFTAANRHLETIDQNIANAAHNTYIQQRFKNVETYLLRAPVDPS